MTKKDLKSGMLVEVRNGDKYTVIFGAHASIEDDDILANHDSGFMRLNSYYDDLTCDSSREYDIIKVFESFGLGGIYKCMDSHLKLLWEREPVRELTIAEIEKLLGFPVKIVKE